jgi:hypothetical protein
MHETRLSQLSSQCLGLLKRCTRYPQNPLKSLFLEGFEAGLFHSHLARLRINSESNSVRVSVSPWEKVV